MDSSCSVTNRKQDDFFSVPCEKSRSCSRRPERPAAGECNIKDIDGVGTQLASMRGKVVVLNFWGLGCAPCKVAIPHRNGLVASFEGDPVEFVAFATDPKANTAKHLKTHPFDYRQVPAAGKVAGDYRVRGWPTHVFIDKRGCVAASFVGGSKDVAERFRPVIERLLREKRSPRGSS